MSIPSYFEPAVRSLRTTIPATQSHLELPSDTLFHGALDMSLRNICIYGKAAILSRGHVCLSLQANHMPTHIKSLSRHNISDGSRFWIGGSRHTGQLGRTRIFIKKQKAHFTYAIGSNQLTSASYIHLMDNIHTSTLEHTSTL